MAELSLPDNPTMADFQRYVREMCEQRGFNRDDIPKKFMMLMEEVGELSKAARKDVGMKLDSTATRQNVAHEAADVLIVFIGLCNALGIDLEQAFREKETYNKQRTWR
jgi:NTP pyrophosphatase (non-canonical NTP hydrolase)